MKELPKTVLCYLKRDNCYLLLFRNKKKNDMNRGKWVGVGGHVEMGETINQAAIREIKEETGLDAHSLSCSGEVTFINDDYEEIMYVYEITDFSGDIIECNEGLLKWIPIKDMYDYPMWEGDKAFLPLLMNHGHYFRMKVYYSKDIFIKAETL